jgi:uncharacterized protein with GYD domain
MLQAAYTSDSWAIQAQNPQDSEALLRTRCGVLGITVLSFYYAFGEYDVVVIVEAPNNVSAATLAITVAAGGAVKALKTTVLLSGAEGLEALQEVGKMAYQPPGGS